MNNFWLLFCYW